jgi:ATP-binding cassette subfamily F protein 2
MPTTWQEKKSKHADFEFEKALQTAADDTTVVDIARDAAMGKGEAELFEKKLSKEEKKARAKVAREAKKKARKKDDDEDAKEDLKGAAANVLNAAKEVVGEVIADKDAAGPIEDDGIDHEQADALAATGTICTFAASRKGVDARARDINVPNFTLQHMGAVLLDETEIVLNHGNR